MQCNVTKALLNEVSSPDTLLLQRWINRLAGWLAGRVSSAEYTSLEPGTEPELWSVALCTQGRVSEAERKWKR